VNRLPDAEESTRAVNNLSKADSQRSQSERAEQHQPDPQNQIQQDPAAPIQSKPCTPHALLPATAKHQY